MVVRRNECITKKQNYEINTAANCAGITQSVLQLATGWTVRRSNPGGGEILRTRSDRP